jgi:hypothetical protein
LPYGIADRFPDCYEACKEISPFASSIREGRGLRVAVHVRRGDLFVVDSHRMLPNAYYIDVAQKVVRELEARGMDYQIELFTEVPHSALTVLPGHHGIATRIQAPVVVTPEMSRLGDFDVLPNLVRHVNGPAIDCIRKLATADVLVMSRSSLSYLAGILNRRGIVLYRPFWHRAPSSWVTVDRDGEFGQATFGKALEGL